MRRDDPGIGVRLDRGFFARPADVVAPQLVGCGLTVDPGLPQAVTAVIVEVEAYLGARDPASHAHRGPTPRAAIMFGPPGHLYVYFTYGMHHCANLVTDVDGIAGAVLLRAAAVQGGGEVVRQRRGRSHALLTDDALLRGPGNLCKGLDLGRKDNGMDVCGDGSRLLIRPGAVTAVPLISGPRVGIRRAMDSPLRFAWAGHPAVSAPRVAAKPLP